ncbi:hypothetical protein C671_1193 [[Clostridium] bifermentans ATCC 19299]|nr:hypothetical protein C671_1193 [[Clostridium] bifermentans ATCC 19299] [Paraclostridium bifermentans ATCC 19299]
MLTGTGAETLQALEKLIVLVNKIKVIAKTIFSFFQDINSHPFYK